MVVYVGKVRKKIRMNTTILILWSLAHPRHHARIIMCIQKGAVFTDANATNMDPHAVYLSPIDDFSQPPHEPNQTTTHIASLSVVLYISMGGLGLALTPTPTQDLS